MSHTFRVGVRLLALSALVATMGCGGEPALQTDSSAAGIRAAEEVGAADVPRASLHLQLAKEQLEKATKLSKDGQSARAASMLARSEADAELAVALSHEEAQKVEARAAIDRVRQLRKDNDLPIE